MEDWLDIICAYAPHAHWILFGLLMLAGFNIPISEDIVLLTGGALASLCIPEEKWHLYAWLFAGCWISAWVAYWIGRLLGPKLYQYQWFSHVISTSRVEKLHEYYEKFGVLVFIVGRFCPGGVRNALFFSSGLGKMPFHKFVLRDGLGCLISSFTIFSLGFHFANNYRAIARAFEAYNLIVIALIIVIVLSIILIRMYLKRRQTLL